MNLSQFIERFASNPWLIITGFIITFLGLLVTIIFYYKTKKKLYYAIRNQNIITDLISKIEFLDMLYDGKRIENLSATKIVFWNGGNETIYRDDIASKSPLTVKVKTGCKILDAKTLIYNPVNQFSIQLSDDKSLINISFEYLAKNEGAVIQLLHTGKSEKDIEILGIMKYSGKPPKQIYTIQTINSGSLIFVGIRLILPVILIVIVSVEGNIFETGNIILSAAMLITSWLWGFQALSRFLPRGLKQFEEVILK